MAPESKDKKRKASDSTNVANPSKKNKKSKNDKALIPADLKSLSKPKPTKLARTSTTTSKATTFATIEPLAGASTKRAASEKQPASELLNATSTTTKASRKRAADSWSGRKEDSDVKITGNPDGVEQKDQSPPKKRTTPKFGKDKSLIAGRTSENATARVPLDAAETKKISHGNDKQVAGVGQIGNDQESEKPHSIQTSTSSIAMKISNLPKAIKSGRTSPEISVTDKVAIAEVKEPLSTLAGNGTADYGGDDRDSDDEEVDGDQTAALIRGFEASDGDDSDENGSTEEEKYENGEDLPKVDIPLKDQAALQALKKKASTSPGVVYIGRVPHGFYENEMRAYFGQFGNIIRLRLSRSKKTGASKHYAFLEFASAEVAEIAAQTMDHYMLFGHLLKCKVIPPSQVPKDLWKGANRRFNKVPWTKLENEKLSKGKTKQQWMEKNKTEQRRRDDKQEKLNSIGYEFKMPELKSPESVSKTTKDVTSSSGDEKDHGVVPNKTTVIAKETPTRVAATEEMEIKQGKERTIKTNEQDGGKNKSIIAATSGTHLTLAKTMDTKPEKERKKHDNKQKDMQPGADGGLIAAKQKSLQAKEAPPKPSKPENAATIEESTKKPRGKKSKKSKASTEVAAEPATLTQVRSTEVETKADAKGNSGKRHSKGERDTIAKETKPGKPQTEGDSKVKKTKKAVI